MNYVRFVNIVSAEMEEYYAGNLFRNLLKSEGAAYAHSFARCLNCCCGVCSIDRGYYYDVYGAYEYIFVDGQIDFDRILNGAKRKTLKRTDLEKIEIVAPEGSHKLDPFSRLPVVDYSSGYDTDRHYIAVATGEKGNEQIRFTPDEKMLSMMRMKAPSKIMEN